MACRARWPCWRRTPAWPASRSGRSSMAGRRPRTTRRDSARRACRSTTCGSPRAPTTWITARACASARARRATVLARRIEPRRARADPVRPLEQERGLVGPAGAPEHQRPIVQRHRHRHVLASVRRFERGDAPAEERLRLVEAPLLAIHDGQRLQARRRRGVRRPQPPLGDLACPGGHRLRLLEPPLVDEQGGDVAERDGLAGMAEPLPDPRRLAQLGLGVRELALEAVRRGESVERRGHARVLGAERALPDLQRAREQPLGLAVAPLGAIVHREVVEAPGDVGVVGVQILLPDRQRLLVEPLGLPDEAAVLADGAEDVDDRRRLEVVGAPPRVEDRARGADLRLRLREAASVVFALTALLPLLLAVLVLHRTGALWTFEAEIAVLLALTVAVLGFVVFRLMVDRVAGLASALAGPGEPGRPTDPTIPGLGRVTEIGQIGDAFTRMLDDLRGSTERLEDLVFKLGALNEVVELAARVPNMQQLLALVLERTMRTVRASIGSIMLLDRQRSVLPRV